MFNRVLACLLYAVPLVGISAGFSDEARSEAANMPAPGYCTDSFLAQIHYDNLSSSSEWAEILDRIDIDSNRQISMEEAMMSSLVTDLFSQIDSDGDGILQQAEVLRFTANMILGEYIEIFRQADLDKNGFFSPREANRIAGLNESGYSDVDINQDGRISFHEYMVWRESVDGVYLRSAFTRLGMRASD